VTLVLDESSLVEQENAQLLFREARQRRRRLRVVRAIIAVVVLVAVAVIGIELRVVPGVSPRSHPPGSPPPSVSGDHSGATLVYAYNNLRVINADTGASRSLPLPAPEGGSSDLQMVKIGDSLLLNRGNTAWLYRPSLDGPPVDLGPSLRVIPGPTADEAWIWSDPCAAVVGCSSPDNGRQQGEVRLVDTSGNQIGSPIPLPADAAWFPTGQVVNAGLVMANVYADPNADEIWNPISDRVIRVLPEANVLAAGGNLVAWTTGMACLPHCTVRLTNVQTGIEQTFQLPAGATLTGGGAFSPDGFALALPVGIGGPWPEMHPTSVALVDLRAQEVRLLAGAEQRLEPNYGPVNVTWSSNGWLFAAAIGSTHVLAWRTGNHSAGVLPTARLPSFKNSLQSQNDLPTLIAM